MSLEQTTDPENYKHQYHEVTAGLAKAVADDDWPLAVFRAHSVGNIVKPFFDLPSMRDELSKILDDVYQVSLEAIPKIEIGPQTPETASRLHLIPRLVEMSHQSAKLGWQDGDKDKSFGKMEQVFQWCKKYKMGETSEKVLNGFMVMARTEAIGSSDLKKAAEITRSALDKYEKLIDQKSARVIEPGTGLTDNLSDNSQELSDLTNNVVVLLGDLITLGLEMENFEDLNDLFEKAEKRYRDSVWYAGNITSRHSAKVKRELTAASNLMHLKFMEHIAQQEGVIETDQETITSFINRYNEAHDIYQWLSDSPAHAELTNYFKYELILRTAQGLILMSQTESDLGPEANFINIANRASLLLGKGQISNDDRFESAKDLVEMVIENAPYTDDKAEALRLQKTINRFF